MTNMSGLLASLSVSAPGAADRDVNSQEVWLLGSVSH